MGKMKNSTRWSLRAAAAVTATAALTIATTVPARAFNMGADIYVQSHFSNVGWVNAWWANGARLEAISFTQAQYAPICARAHVANVGWQSERCTSGKGSTIVVGTTGRGLAIEALQIRMPTKSLQLFARSTDWGSYSSTVGKNQTATVGTTGRSLPLMAWSVNITS